MIKHAFINYRRDDSSSDAKLIANALADSLSADTVFMDTEAINLGDQWPERIRSALSNAHYVIVVVGPEWLTAGTDTWGRRRIDSESDWVRQEIAFALNDCDKTVIPVLVRDASIPPADALPECIAPLTDKQAITIRRDYWDHDIKLLIHRLTSRTNLDQLANVNPLLKPIWRYLDDDLRQIMAVSATLAQLENKNYMSTTNFVKALMVLKPGRISEFFNKLPEGALPDSVPADIPMRFEALKSLDSFSPCINSAMSNLTPKVTPAERLSSEDVYVDIARHGTGKSTKLLRSRGVSKADVEHIVGQLGWHLVERRLAKPTNKALNRSGGQRTS